MRFHFAIPFKVLAFLTTSAIAAPKEKPVPPPPLTYSTPAAAMPGRTTRVTFQGAVSGQPLGLWTSFPAEVTRPADAGKEAIFDLKVPADVPVGIYAVRLASTAGLSNLQLFMVDDLPSAAQRTVQPQILTLPIAIDGACQSLGTDVYQFDAKKGQRIAFEIVAQRLGSRLDPIVRIVDSTGREVAYCDDTAGLGSDCRFSHTFAADGRYALELRDAEYQGGSEYRYHLRIGNFPTATVAFPLGGQRDSKRSFSFASPGDPSAITRPVQLGSAVCMNFGLKNSDSDSSGFLSILGGDADDFIAPAGNHSFKAAAHVPLPVTISGRFDIAGAQDFYAIDAKKGDRLAILARTRSVNSPCDLLLQFFKPDGAKMAESKAVAADEGSLDLTIPADGAYRLSARDLSGEAGPAYVYRLEVNRVAPGFTLTVDSDKLDGTAGGVVRRKVKCARREFDGAILLSLTGDAASFEMKNQTIAAGKSETDLEIKLPADMPGKFPLGFTVTGKAMIAGVQHIETASTIAILKNLFPRLPYPPPELDGIIGLNIRPATR